MIPSAPRSSEAPRRRRKCRSLIPSSAPASTQLNFFFRCSSIASVIRAILTSGSMRSLRRKPDRSCAPKPGHISCQRQARATALGRRDLVGYRAAPHKEGRTRMRCIECGSQAVTERPERTAQGYRRFRCRACGKQFNERSDTLLNRAQYPSDVIALVVLWRLRYKLSLRDLPEMFLVRGIVFSHEAVREWEAKLTPALAEGLRRRRRGKVGKSWYVDETYIKVHGHWRYLYRAIDRNGVLSDSAPA